MDEIIAILAFLFRWIIEIFLWFFTKIVLEVLFEIVFYNIGYYSIKIITLGVFPKSEKGNREMRWTYIAMFGLLIFIVLGYFLTKNIYA